MGRLNLRSIESWLEEAIQKQPDSTSTLLEGNLGTLLYKEGRFDESEVHYRRVLARDRYHLESLNNLAWQLALRDPSKTQEALELINRAIEFHGTLTNLVGTRAVVLIRAKQFDQALHELRVAKAGDPVNPSFSLSLAWALHATGSTDEARREFRVANQLGLTAAMRDPLCRRYADALRQALSSN